MRVVVDRVEGDYAVCESDNHRMINIPLKNIPFAVREGIVLIFAENGIELDYKETQKRKKEIEDMTRDLWK